MGEQEGTFGEYSNVCIPELTLVISPEMTRRNLHHFPLPLGHRPRRLAGQRSPLRPRGNSLLHHCDQHLL